MLIYYFRLFIFLATFTGFPFQLLLFRVDTMGELGILMFQCSIWETTFNTGNCLFKSRRVPKRKTVQPSSNSREFPMNT